MTSNVAPMIERRDMCIPAAGVTLTGDLTMPAHAHGLVIFAHGSGSSRLSPRNQRVSAWLQHANLGTLLFELLTPGEAAIDATTRQHRFDIPLLASRLAAVTDWVVAPGLELTVERWKLEFSSQTEYVIDLGDGDGNFLYTWSQLGILPVDWL